MNYGKFILADTANGVGCRTTVFVSGCNRHCKGCFNEETWDFGYGYPFSWKVESFILRSLKQPGCDGLSILGGEPMDPRNQGAVYHLARKAKEIGTNIWLYTGYTYEELTDPLNVGCQTTYTQGIIDLLDVMVDGPFIEEQKDITLLFRGSKNQRLIDVPESRKAGKVALWEGNTK